VVITGSSAGRMSLDESRSSHGVFMSQAHVPSMTTSHPPARVLVVEDDEKLAALLRRALAEDGLQTMVAFDGASALDRALEEPFDALLLDVGLPRLSGLEMCARLRDAGRDIPVVMLSARDSVDDCLDGRGTGAVDYIIKPFSVAEVTARLHEVIAAALAGPHGQLIDAA
jgi:DNA-binding response OmpR family regulator